MNLTMVRNATVLAYPLVNKETFRNIITFMQSFAFVADLHDQEFLLDSGTFDFLVEACILDNRGETLPQDATVDETSARKCLRLQLLGAGGVGIAQGFMMRSFNQGSSQSRRKCPLAPPLRHIDFTSTGNSHRYVYKVPRGSSGHRDEPRDASTRATLGQIWGRDCCSSCNFDRANYGNAIEPSTVRALGSRLLLVVQLRRSQPQKRALTTTSYYVSAMQNSVDDAEQHREQRRGAF